MCARVNIIIDDEELEEILRDIDRLYHQAKQEIDLSPGDSAAVLCGPNLEPSLLKWGFPHWQGKGLIFNTRSESALEKKMFRNATENRRCVLPTSGFYEWDKNSGAKKKDKYLLRIPGEPVVAIACIYDSFADPLGTRYDAFSVLTTDASESVSAIHHRMPVLLRRDELHPWVTDISFARHVLTRAGFEMELKKVG